MVITASGLALWKMFTTVTQIEPLLKSSQQIHVAVLPHHDLILDQFPNFYKMISEEETFNKIIVLSPNHSEPEAQKIKMRTENFDFEDLAVIVAALPSSSYAVIEEDNQVFDQEHGVLLHLPLIAQFFPDTPVTSLLLTRRVPAKDLDILVSQLKPEIDKKTLIIVSTDFSHGLPFSEAEKNDRDFLDLLQNGNVEDVLQLSDEYTDCSSCMYVALSLLEEQKEHFQVLYHGNSKQYVPINRQEQTTTSYFVIKW